MKTKTALFLELWIESRTRFTNQIANFTENDLQKKLVFHQILLVF